MSVDRGDVPPPPPPPPPPPHDSPADQPVTDEGPPAPEDTPSPGADTAATIGSGTFEGTAGNLAPADVPMVDDGQAAPDLPASAVGSSGLDAAPQDGVVTDGSGDTAPEAEPDLPGSGDSADAGGDLPADADVPDAADAPGTDSGDTPQSGGGIPDWTYSPDMATTHGRESVEQHNGHGVSSDAPNDAVQNPQIVEDDVDDLGRHATTFVGNDALVILNDNGQVVTAWPTNRNGYRYP